MYTPPRKRKGAKRHLFEFPLQDVPTRFDGSGWNMREYLIRMSSGEESEGGRSSNGNSSHASEAETEVGEEEDTESTALLVDDEAVKELDMDAGGGAAVVAAADALTDASAVGKKKKKKKKKKRKKKKQNSAGTDTDTGTGTSDATGSSLAGPESCDCSVMDAEGLSLQSSNEPLDPVDNDAAFDDTTEGWQRPATPYYTATSARNDAGISMPTASDVAVALAELELSSGGAVAGKWLE
eukprot:UC1_evm1s1863